MKIVKMNEQIKGFEGKPLPGDTGIPITFKTVFIECLGSFSDNNNRGNVMQAWRLGFKVVDCNAKTLPIEDAEFKILNVATKISRYGAVVMGAVYDMLERAEKEKVVKK